MGIQHLKKIYLRHEKEEKTIQAALLELKLMMVFMVLVILKLWKCCVEVQDAIRVGRKHPKNRGRENQFSSVIFSHLWLFQ